eukprot:1987434-Rhodomonas_salina.2
MRRKPWRLEHFQNADHWQRHTVGQNRPEPTSHIMHRQHSTADLSGTARSECALWTSKVSTPALGRFAV